MRWRLSHEAAQFSDNLPVTTWVNKLEIPGYWLVFIGGTGYVWYLGFKFQLENEQPLLFGECVARVKKKSAKKKKGMLERRTELWGRGALPEFRI